MVSKLIRFILIYGFFRALVKAMGRLRYNLPIWVFLKFPFYRFDGKKISLIGCGHHSYSSLAYYLTAKSNARIVSCYDIDKSRQRSLCHAYLPKNRSCNSTSVFSPSCDLVYIASNHSTHAEYALAALKAGKNVYIEKPICTSLDQLHQINSVVMKSDCSVFTGYNRPHAPAIKGLIDLSKISSDPISFSCSVIGHQLDQNHWYRSESEGTRVLSNIGHWIDLWVHLLYTLKDGLPTVLKCTLAVADASRPSENISLALTSSDGDIASIFFSVREDPFEGVSEVIRFQRGSMISTINDFRVSEIWNGEHYKKTKFFPKDNGHKNTALLPVDNSRGVVRTWEETYVSARLVLYINELVLQKKETGFFNIHDILAERILNEANIM